MHQTIDLRVGIKMPHFMGFGDAHTREKYYREVVEPARERARAKGYRYAVAPDARIQLPDGSYLEPGQQVRMQMFAGVVDTARNVVPAWRILDTYVQTGRVLETSAPDEDEPEPGPQAA